MKKEISRDRKHRRFSIDVVTENDGGRWASKPLEKPSYQGREQQLDTADNDDAGRRGFPYNDYAPHDADSQSNGDVGNLFLEMQNASIHGPASHTTTQHTTTQRGSEEWLQDKIIDVGSDFIEKIMQSEKHNIALSNVYYATHLFKTGHWVKAREDAADEDQATYIEAGSHKIDSEIRKNLETKISS